MGLSSIVSKASAAVAGSPSHGHAGNGASSQQLGSSPSQDKAPEGAAADDTE